MHWFIQYFLVPYSSGLLAAISPCLIMMVPMLLFRFTLVDRHALNNLPIYLDEDDASMKPVAKKKRTGIMPILGFVLGFQCSFVTLGFCLTQLLDSSIQNGFKLGMGALFLITAALSKRGLIDPLSLPILNNTFLMGAVFAMMVSVNPCTVPFLAVIISLTLSKGLLGLVLFAQGLLTPALVFLFIGEKLVVAVETYIKPEHLDRIKGLTSGVLFIAGGWLMNSVSLLTGADALVAALWIPVVFTLILRRLPWKSQKITRNLILLGLSLFVVTLGVINLFEHEMETHAVLNGVLTSELQPTDPDPSLVIAVETAILNDPHIVPGYDEPLEALRLLELGDQFQAGDDHEEHAPHKQARHQAKPTVTNSKSGLGTQVQVEAMPAVNEEENTGSQISDIDLWLKQQEALEVDESQAGEPKQNNGEDETRAALQCVDMSLYPPCQTCLMVVRLSIMVYGSLAVYIYKS